MILISKGTFNSGSRVRSGSRLRKARECRCFIIERLEHREQLGRVHHLIYALGQVEQLERGTPISGRHKLGYQLAHTIAVDDIDVSHVQQNLLIPIMKGRPHRGLNFRRPGAGQNSAFDDQDRNSLYRSNGNRHLPLSGSD